MTASRLSKLLGEIKVPQYPTGFELFEPLATRGSFSISIATYGLARPEEMEPVLSRISSSAERRLLMGYSKESHDPNILLTKLSAYKSLGWNVRMLPSCHFKIWIVDRRAWVGSCNFCPSTIVNGMWRVPLKSVEPLFNLYWRQASALSRSTDLLLIPQAKIRHDARPRNKRGKR